MNIKTLQDKYRNREISVFEYIKKIYENIEKNNYNSYITLNKEEALKKAKELDDKIEKGIEINGLFGVPVAVKDNILTKDLRTTAASKSLSNYVPFFDAIIIERMNESNAINIGKANMDEFAMGSSSETSFFGPSINPFNPEYTPGGSSSGSATAIAGEEAVVALGTDTGGSVRNPADFCNIVGFAPTYGAIPRHGVISMSNSFDRVGVMGNTTSDVRELFKVIKGKCDSDFTTIDIEDFTEELNIKDLKIAILELKDIYDIDEKIRYEFNKTIEKLKSLGANIDIVPLEYIEYINQVYTVIMSIEVESNIAKIDGLRYGESVNEYLSTEEFYIQNRTKNFGEEVKRRISLGNLFSSKDFDQKYYKQAMKIRGKVKEQIDKIFENYDCIITPTTTKLPKKVGETIKDSYSSFDSGMFNMITNLSNIPAISIPMENNKFGSIQIAGKRFEDMKLLKISEIIEGAIK